MVEKFNPHDPDSFLPKKHEEVLKLLARKNRPMLFGEIANNVAPKLGVSPTTIRDVLRDLMRLGYVVKLSKGLYTITDAGLSLLGIRTPKMLWKCATDSIAKALTILASYADEDLREAYNELLIAQNCLTDLKKML